MLVKDVSEPLQLRCASHVNQSGWSEWTVENKRNFIKELKQELWEAQRSLETKCPHMLKMQDVEVTNTIEDEVWGITYQITCKGCDSILDCWYEDGHEG